MLFVGKPRGLCVTILISTGTFSTPVSLLKSQRKPIVQGPPPKIYHINQSTNVSPCKMTQVLSGVAASPYFGRNRSGALVLFYGRKTLDNLDMIGCTKVRNYKLQPLYLYIWYHMTNIVWYIYMYICSYHCNILISGCTKYNEHPFMAG